MTRARRRRLVSVQPRRPARRLRRVPPSGALHRHPVPSTRPATLDVWGSRRSRTSRSVSEALFVQHKEDQSERAGPTGSDTWRWQRTDEGAAACTSSWRGAAPSRYIVEYLKDVSFGYTSATVVSGLQFLRRRRGARRGFVCVHEGEHTSCGARWQPFNV
jgi:hypothetical protein